MTRLRHLACLAALLIPFTVRAQVGVVDHDWSFQTRNGRVGIMQITYPGPATYTFFYLGKSEQHVHARISVLVVSILAPLTATILLLAWLGPKRRTETKNQS